MNISKIGGKKRDRVAILRLRASFNRERHTQSFATLSLLPGSKLNLAIVGKVCSRKAGKKALVGVARQQRHISVGQQ